MLGIGASLDRTNNARSVLDDYSIKKLAKQIIFDINDWNIAR